mgnify:FL=1
MKQQEYPPASIVDVDIPLWPQAQAQSFILDRVLAHQASRADPENTLCSAEERWARGGEWAVVKQGNKRASKLFPNNAREEAIGYAFSLGPEYNVEAREREYTRCEYFCKVGRANLCAQFSGDPGGGGSE